jgi:hypothetical protein
MARAAVLGRLTWLAGQLAGGGSGVVPLMVGDRQIKTERFGPSGGTP